MNLGQNHPLEKEKTLSSDTVGHGCTSCGVSDPCGHLVGRIVPAVVL